MAGARLDRDGPHSGQNTVALADLFAETVRVLNHATQKASGLRYPSQVYEVLGALASGVAGLPQLLVQLQAFLFDQYAAGRLGEDADGPHHGDPDAALATFVDQVRAAEHAAQALTAALQQAQTATAGLHALPRSTGGGRP